MHLPETRLTTIEVYEYSEREHPLGKLLEIRAYLEINLFCEASGFLGTDEKNYQGKTIPNGSPISQGIFTYLNVNASSLHFK